MKLTPQQIGKCGELLVQYQLLSLGVETAHLTTDDGIDLVAYSPKRAQPLTIQVKTNLKPKPGGGKGKEALDWWVPEKNPADLLALVDLSGDRIWLMTHQELSQLAQQKPKDKYHIYMYVDPTVKVKNPEKLAFVFEFERYRLKNRVDEFFH